MSRIDELISKLAPEGVSFKTLGEVLRIKNGRDHKSLGDGDIPVYGSGGIMRYVDTAAAEGPSVLIPRKGSLGNIFYVEGPFWVVDTIFRTEIDTALVEPKFVYHQLMTMGLGDMNQAGGVPSQTQSVLNLLRIPVPPLEVQREIVRVLDQFTLLEAELEAELEARRRQYEHYRTRAFDFSADIDVRWSTLGEISTRVSSGATPKAGTPEYYDGGTIPWLRTGEVTFGEIWDTEMKITDRALKETGASWIKENCVIVAISGATAARSAINKIPLTTNQHCCNLQIDDAQANYRYVFFWVSSKYEELKAFGRGARSDLNAKLIKDFPIPVPSLDEQRRIVSLLDKFDALVNDLSVGLPAELAARRKQYEYYRDKLLTFEAAVA